MVLVNHTGVRGQVSLAGGRAESYGQRWLKHSRRQSATRIPAPVVSGQVLRTCDRGMDVPTTTSLPLPCGRFGKAKASSGVSPEEESGVGDPKTVPCVVVTLVSVYGPTLAATQETKDEFYESLATAVKSGPISEQLALLGDFNARVGADS